MFMHRLGKRDRSRHADLVAEEEASQALDRARAAASALRWRVSAPPLLLGAICIAFVGVSYFARVSGESALHLRRSTYGPFMFGGGVLLALAVLPTDEALLRLIALIAVPSFLALALLNARVGKPALDAAQPLSKTCPRHVPDTPRRQV